MLTEENKEHLEVIQERIIDQIAYNMKLYGMSPTVGRLMATIHYNQKPMTLDEMSEELGMSKMSMSNAVRELMDLGVAEKVYKKDTRKDLYIVEQDYFQFFISLFCATWRKTVTTKRATRMKTSNELEAILHDENETEETKEEARRIIKENNKAIEYFDWLSRLIEHFESHEIFESVPRNPKETSSYV